MRGIGVAVITSRCGVSPSGALARNRSRCSTPNRCCSSTTTMPSRLNSTASCNSACVPMTMPASPAATSSRTSRFCCGDIDPVSSATRVASSAPPSCPAIASGPRTSRMDRACWAARTSVGASSAHWYPASTICSMASTETMVLPEPTSPCSMRFIGRVAASSADSTVQHFLWPSVNSNGNCSRIAATQTVVLAPARADRIRSVRRIAAPTNAHCSPTASSNVSRSTRARVRPRSRRGGSPAAPRLRKSDSAAAECDSGSGSSTGSSTSSTWRTQA